MMEEFRYDIRIPKERVAVLIGKKGETKAMIEKETDTKMDIDSSEGDITITGNDSLKLYNAKEIIGAVGRGFNPKIALKLTKIDYSFEIINVSDIARSKNDLQRLKGRVIGNEGKSRKVIESLTDSEISVYGKTIAIIGPVEEAPIVKKAIEMLLNGSMHSGVFKYLEKHKRDLKAMELKSGKL